MLLARLTGMVSGLTYTEQPMRSRRVHAAAYVIASVGLRRGAEPRTCSWAHALSKPSSSARAR